MFRVAFFALLVMTMVAGALHLGALPARADQATVTWSAPSTNTNGTAVTDLAGYKVYIGTASGSYSQKYDVGNVNSYTAVNLNSGSTYYFAITAYDTTGLESAYSKEVSKAIAAAPTTYTITATAGAGGTISALNNTNVSVASNSTSTVTTVTVTSAASQAFSITPSTGYKVQGVTVDGASVGAVTSYTFSNVTANHTISATFATTSYSITASAGTGGSISPSGTTSVASGGSQSYTITPSTGYTVQGVTVDGASVGAVTSYTFSNVTANHTISATFAAAITSYSITASAGAGGSISPSGTKSVASGGSQSYTITPATGYSISSVSVDGASVGAVSSYTFSNVTANHTIQASFTATTTSKTVFATNSAGPQYVSSSTGVTYAADTKYSGGGAGSTTASISGTSDPTLYKTERWGNFSYSIPVTNGNYSLTLKFAEIYWSAAGKRVFNVVVNGQTAISKLDIYSKVGKNVAYDVVIPVSVTNGAINVTFQSVVDYAKVNAILVKSN